MRYALITILILTTHTFAQERTTEWVREANIPSSVKKTFTSRRMDERYKFSFHLNPFYLRGDFNGDGKYDHALLIQEKRTGKIGIAVFHSGKNQVFILGAGTMFGNGGDSFDWMDIWSVYPKGLVQRGVGEKRIPILRGEALSVEKSEAASGLIYWDGKKYVWYQQGD